eukprot:7465297-Heterocapsa_arctica.AAC.1
MDSKWPKPLGMPSRGPRGRKKREGGPGRGSGSPSETRHDGSQPSTGNSWKTAVPRGCRGSIADEDDN